MKRSTPLAAIRKHILSASLLTMASSFAVVQAETIDVLVLYSNGFQTQYGTGVESRINQIFSTANQTYQDSNLNATLRVVHAQMVNYSDTIAPETALRALSCDWNIQSSCVRGTAFQNVSAWREQYGADIVVMLRPYQSTHGGVCGIAWIGGNQTNGNLNASTWRESGMSQIGVDGPCHDWVTAHEIGHNLGLNHSSIQDSRGGTYPWAWGYGQYYDFATIMAYEWLFGANTKKAYKYSSPALDCYGKPCGISRTASNGADAVHALSVTFPQVANYTATVVPDDGSNTGGILNDSNGAGSDNGVTNDNPTVEDLLAIFEQERDKFFVVKTEFANAKKAFALAKKTFTVAKREYAKAQKLYTSAGKKVTQAQNNLNKAILAYNKYVAAGSSVKPAMLEKSYTLVTKRIEQYNLAVENYNTAAANLQTAESVYPDQEAAFAEAQAAFATVQAAFNAQKLAMDTAKKEYTAAKKAAALAARRR